MDTKKKRIVLEARDVLQTIILREIFARTKSTGEIALKGGMAMRVAARSVRLTKDIDLAGNPSVQLTKLQSHIRAALKAAVKANALVENIKITEPKQTDTVARWKINGNLIGVDEKVQITIEISRRGIPPKEYIASLTYIPPPHYNLSPVLVDTYTLETLMITKLAAMMSPVRTAPRDLYDLALLTDLGVTPDKALIESFVAHKGDRKPIKDLIAEIWKKIDTFSWEQFKNEVLPFLPESHAVRYDEDMFNQIQVKVGEKIQAFLEPIIAAKLTFPINTKPLMNFGF